MRKRDIERACKFTVGTEVCTYPFPEDAFGWSPVLVGNVVQIISHPNLKTKHPGEFVVKWNYVGSTLVDLNQAKLPNPILGHLLRFKA